MAPSLLPRVAASLAALTTGLQLIPFQPSFTKIQLNNVHDKLNEIAERSWERGTQAQALTEYNWPALSVFSDTFPPRINATYNASDVLSIATETVRTKKVGSLTLTEDGSAADPASLGTAVLLANWTKTDLSDKRFSQAAGQQLQYLLEFAPKSDAGAISHRGDQVQFWSDFIYMVPPFISYFGALQGGDSGRALGQTAYNQIALYRQALRTPESNLWKHIVQGSFQDNTHWATGNAWAAAGMLRVHQTLAHSDRADEFKPHRANLTEWIEEILDASWKFQTSSGALRNVIDDSSTFEDASGTALIAAVTYRMAAITNSTSAIANANRAHKFISENIDKDGWLHKTVDPMKFHEPSKDGEYSPEGQAFVLLLHAAWRDAVKFFGKRVSWDD